MAAVAMERISNSRFHNTLGGAGVHVHRIKDALAARSFAMVPFESGLTERALE